MEITPGANAGERYDHSKIYTELPELKGASEELVEALRSYLIEALTDDKIFRQFTANFRAGFVYEDGDYFSATALSQPAIRSGGDFTLQFTMAPTYLDPAAKAIAELAGENELQWRKSEQDKAREDKLQKLAALNAERRALMEELQD